MSSSRNNPTGSPRSGDLTSTASRPRSGPKEAQFQSGQVAGQMEAGAALLETQLAAQFVPHLTPHLTE